MDSSYDAVAQWYAEFTRYWLPVCLPYLPEDLRGQRVLDLACGTGALSRLIADRGGTVTAIDLSTQMLHHASTTDRVQYRQGDATGTRWWDGEPFDGVVSNMALMDIDDLDAALGTIATVAKSEGGSSSRCCTRASPADPTQERCRAGHHTAATRGRAGGPPTPTAFEATSAPSIGCSRPISTP
jgi:ubiquinone/menaquinone biosynthesis C-methylase UbiE